MNEMSKKLKNLSNWYYVLVILCIPASYSPQITLLVNMKNAGTEMNGVLIFFLIGGLIGSLLLVAIIAFTALGIRKQKWWTYCYTVSLLICPAFPLGTALGIYSVKTLNTPDVKQLFT